MKEEERLKGRSSRPCAGKGWTPRWQLTTIGELDVSMEAKVAEQRHVDAEVSACVSGITRCRSI